MNPLELAIQSVHKLDVFGLAKVRATVAARIDSLTENQVTPGSSRLGRWWQRVTQPHHYAKAREKENRALREQVRRLTREVQRLKGE